MIRRILTTLVTLALVGCATKHEQKPLEDVVLVPKETKVNVPAETLRPCEPLPQMEERAYTESEVLAFMQQVVTPYADCKARKRDSDAVLRKSLNISK